MAKIENARRLIREYLNNKSLKNKKAHLKTAESSRAKSRNHESTQNFSKTQRYGFSKYFISRNGSKIYLYFL